jgi:hypothetical protein
MTAKEKKPFPPLEWFKNLPLQVQLALGFLAFCYLALVLGVGATSIVGFWIIFGIHVLVGIIVAIAVLIEEFD